MARDFLIATAVAVSVLVLLEGSMQLGGSRFSGNLLIYDPVRYYGLLEHGGAWAHEEGAVLFLRTNQAGYRDVDHSIETPRNTLRIAILGDSLSTGFQVPLEQTYPRVAERDMNAVRPLEILNFGVPGYSIAQEFLTLKTALNYHPRMVLLQLNPLWSIYRSSTKTQWRESIQYPNFELKEGQLVPDQYTREHPAESHGLSPAWQRIANYSQLYCLYKAISRKVEAYMVYRAGVLDRSAQHEYDATVPPQTAEMEEAWRISEGLILAIRDEAAKGGARLLLVVTDIAPLSSPLLKDREEVVAKANCGDCAYSERRLSQFAAAHGIGCILLSNEIRRVVAETGRSLHTSRNAGHWNKEGHQVVARVIADTVLRSSAISDNRMP